MKNEKYGKSSEQLRRKIIMEDIHIKGETK